MKPIQKLFVRVVGSAVTVLATLLTGLLTTESLWSFWHSGYAQSPIGLYYGSFHGFITIHDLNAPLDGSLRFEGKSATRWQWKDSPLTYSELALSWYEDEPTVLGGRVRLFLPSFRFENSLTNGVMTPEGLAFWLSGNDPRVSANPNISTVVQPLFQLFRSAGEGTLPPPRHHGYHERGSLITSSYYHFRLGFGLSAAGWLWLLAWPVVSVFVLQKLLRRINRPDGGEPPSPLTPHLS